MANFPIIPTLAIFVGLVLLEYIIYDSYKQNKAKQHENPSIKDFSIHEQSQLLEANVTPSMIELPSLNLNQAVALEYSGDHFSQHHNVENTLRQVGENRVIDPILNSPPIPQTGLPNGWSIEQWNYYGAQWLESRKES